MKKRKLRMQLKDIYANISGMYMKYFTVESAVDTPTLPHPALALRCPWNCTRGGGFICHAPLFHLAQSLTCFLEFKRLTLTGQFQERGGSQPHRTHDMHRVVTISTDRP